MRYVELFTNRYSLALLAIAVFALLCIMATSEVTAVVILIKFIGFALVYAYARLFKKWDKEGKVDVIKQLFNDNEEEEL